MRKPPFSLKYRPLLLTLPLLLLTGIGSFAQTPKAESKAPSSLDGLTEAILIDGRPALRIVSSRSGVVEIKFEPRDGEDSLVFAVTRLKSFGLGVQPADSGKLFITKSRIIYVPNLDKEGFFSALTSEVVNVELKKLGQGFETVNFVFRNDKKRFIFEGTVFMTDSVWGGLRFNKKDLRPPLDFLFRALRDYNAASQEFNRLTASVLQTEEEDTETEEGPAEVADKYDRFKDITIVTTTRMLVKGRNRSIRIHAEYTFPGRKQNSPLKVTLYFHSSASRPTFREGDLELNFLVDNKRIPLGQLRFTDEEKVKTLIKQTISIDVPYDVFAQIIRGRDAEFQIGSNEYRLTDPIKDAFKKLLDYKIEE